MTVHSWCWLFRLAGVYLKLGLFVSKMLSWVEALLFGVRGRGAKNDVLR